MHDVTQKDTFDNLEYWLQEVQKYSTNADAVKMLVANKVDEPQVVTREEAEEYHFNNFSILIQIYKKKLSNQRDLHPRLKKILNSGSRFKMRCCLSKLQQRLAKESSKPLKRLFRKF